MTASAPHRAPRSWLQKLGAIEDGAILRFAFFAMLAGTGLVLVMDYRQLNENGAAPQTGHLGDPVLPAVERPEIDPSNPAFSPAEQITTPREVLAAPLSIELVPGGILEFVGTIGAGASGAFAAEVERRGAYIETVSLNSPGGAVEEALAIAAIIAAEGFDTRVEAGALCASSCPLILAAGATRHISEKASVGIHQIYAFESDAGRIGPAQAMSDAQMITARIARHFEASGIDPALWVHALETPPDRLYYLTLEQMRQYKLISGGLG
ncbi:hypothetical protein [Pelagibacterium limicola]|uniref:COG3904 family protein n=1 Tax=Pelagibacterium limicola TaxID=2791022 RepID=UPI0018AFCD16|nr:hypothetical protein [Pelagibacterium limicola]